MMQPLKRCLAVFAITVSAALSHAGTLQNVAQVAAGFGHTCALTTGGGVKCWGWNAAGQLGDGTQADHLTPVDVVGLGSGVVAIAMGDVHTCALTGAGGVKCWGSNYLGQLGSGPTGSPFEISATPVDVPGLASGVVALSAGSGGGNGFSTCALLASGGAKCWGNNYWGQLGDGMMADTYGVLPVDVTVAPMPIASIAMGGDHACALNPSGGVRCWGYGLQGQLGDGTQDVKPSGADVAGLGSGIGAIAASTGKSCAIVAATRALKCWGLHLAGPTFYDYQLVPTDVPGLASGTASVAPGRDLTCALTTSGGVKCWGYGGVVGDGTTTLQTIPTDVIGLTSGAAQVSSGNRHACAVTSSGTVKCWGSNDYGQIGNRTATTSPVLAPATVLSFVAQTIDFGALADRDLTAAPFDVSATASSGLPVIFSSVTPWTCTVSGTTVSLVSRGKCGIAADQGGDDDTYDIAPTVVRSFEVLAAVPPQPRLANLSTRARMGLGTDVAIGGFVIGGSSPKTIAVRALGPTLAAYGLPAASIASLELYSASALIASNSSWQRAGTTSGAQVAPPAALSVTGLAPAYRQEAALIATLAPGAYTAIAWTYPGIDLSVSGIQLVEVYELDQPGSPLLNLSTRGYVGTDGEVMIAGFVIQGDSELTVVITGKGPSLSKYGVANALANPTLTLVRQSDQVVIATNDDWQQSPEAAQIAAAGFAPSDRGEAAILMTLPPGAYTALLSGVDGGTGAGLVEVYRVSP